MTGPVEAMSPSMQAADTTSYCARSSGDTSGASQLMAAQVKHGVSEQALYEGMMGGCGCMHFTP